MQRVGNPSVLRQVAFDLDEMLVVSQRDYIFEKMCLVASQLPLTREPRKECEAKDSVEWTRIEGSGEVGGKMSGEESVER